ncbi:flagellar basal body protein [Ruminococcaceae bacterium OttesenSCG-928-I18]|nr:flagellar basal body protein [Ruminococcaceae bacterium OttesenSCG-928-I18]
MLFDNYSTRAAEASLDSLWLKTKVISNNLANVDTPGFKASSVGFEQVLRNKSESLAARSPYNDDNQRQNTDANQMQAGNSSNGDPQAVDANNANMGNRGARSFYRTNVTQNDSTNVRIDGNNVSLEKEQTELWKAYAQYSYLLDRVSGHYNSINSAISNSRV